MCLFQKCCVSSKTEGCFLIVCPGSVLYNWLDELDTWGYFKAKLYHGNSKKGVLEQAAKGKLDVVLTTYETMKINLVSGPARTRLNPRAFACLCFSFFPWFWLIFKLAHVMSMT